MSKLKLTTYRKGDTVKLTTNYTNTSGTIPKNNVGIVAKALIILECCYVDFEGDQQNVLVPNFLLIPN